MAPGPTPVPPEVLAAGAEPVLHHRGPDFRALMLRTLGRLQEVCRTQNDVLLFTASGSAAFESAVVNLLSPGERVLTSSRRASSANAGRALATAYGADVHELRYAWGETPRAEDVRARLDETGAEVVFVVHSETSTGVVSDVQALAQVARDAGALVVVDAVSSLGAVPLETDAWGLDVVVAGSQKALMTPPGLSLATVSPAAWERSLRVDDAALLLRLGANCARRSRPGRRRSRRRSPSSPPRPRARAPARGGARCRVRPSRRARPRLPGGREGDGPRALLAGRGAVGGRHRDPDAGRRRRAGSSSSRCATASGSPSRVAHGELGVRCSGSGTSATTTSSTSRQRSPPSRRCWSRMARTSSVVSRLPGPSRPTRRRACLATTPAARPRPRADRRARGSSSCRSRFDVVEDSDSDLADDHRRSSMRSSCAPATRLDAALIERAARLKVIGRAGVGVDNVDVDAATRRGIVVANAAESTVVSAAEHAIALLFALARNVPQAHSALTAGNLGRGAIRGRRARREDARRARSRAHRPRGRAACARARAARRRVRPVRRERALPRARSRAGRALWETSTATRTCITLHLPLNDETRGRARRGRVRADAGRRAHRERRSRRAGRRGSARWTRSAPARSQGRRSTSSRRSRTRGRCSSSTQVIVTPHLAGSTSEAQDRAGVVIAEQIAAALDGEIVQTAVNIPIVEQGDLEALGPFVPLAAKLGRLAMALAASWPRATRRLRARAALGARHAPADRRCAERRLPGPCRRDGELRQRAGHRRRAGDRGVGAALLARPGTTRTSSGSPSSADGEETEVSGTTVGPEHRLFLAGALGFDLDIELAPLHGVPRLRRRPGRDREGRDDVRRRGREHREHGRLEDEPRAERRSWRSRSTRRLRAELVERVRAAGFDDARLRERCG